MPKTVLERFNNIVNKIEAGNLREIAILLEEDNVAQLMKKEVDGKRILDFVNSQNDPDGNISILLKEYGFLTAQEAAQENSFNKRPADDPRFLYHGTPYDIEDVLHPNKTRTALGRGVTSIFLGPDLVAAYGYALKTKQALGQIPYIDDSIIFRDRDDFLKEFKQGYIYCFDRDGEYKDHDFQQSEKRSANEWIYVERSKTKGGKSVPKSLDIGGCQVINVPNVEFALSKGLQLFFFKKMQRFDEFSPGMVFSTYLRKLPEDSFFKAMGELIKSGVIIYENYVRNEGVKYKVVNDLGLTKDDLIKMKNFADDKMDIPIATTVRFFETLSKLYDKNDKVDELLNRSKDLMKESLPDSSPADSNFVKLNPERSEDKLR